MSTKEGNAGETTEIYMQDSSVDAERHLSDMYHGSNRNLTKENGLQDDTPLTQIAHDKLNEFLKSQFEALKNLQSADDGSQQRTEARDKKTGKSADMDVLHKMIESLNRELLEEKQKRGAAEEALKHLREAHFEADAKSQEQSAKLAEDKEIKECEEKYSELDSKFQRLHKRAKQLIQEVQKERDDLEAQFHEINKAAERASLQQSTLQQDIERKRQQANDALKAMDAERQQLRSANNK
ncbi:hypothetical protein P3X46_029098 [Hevea brasiliensis]|uniref:Uncharacterized protein n=1 Tax=Hevea brasiliensis TaxID=3981 RepID=A0ABQ9KU91_HEVBR|nr:hypothetical protein P3X46_029098 [Hevea brasiliensis]